MLTKRQTIWVVAGATVVAALLFGRTVLLYWIERYSTVTEIRKLSPNRQHAARLITRELGFDLNVCLDVDGTRVYWSPDFARPATDDFRESLWWDKSGTIALVEIAGRRVFGYDARNRKTLTEAELANLPLSSFDDLKPAAWEAVPPEISAQPMLDGRIGPATPAYYRTISSGDWGNPRLDVTNEGFQLKSLSLPKPRFVALADLRRVLAQLPISDWPYGRVVVVQSPSIRPQDASWITAVQRNVAGAITVVADLGAAWWGWPP